MANPITVPAATRRSDRHGARFFLESRWIFGRVYPVAGLLLMLLWQGAAQAEVMLTTGVMKVVAMPDGSGSRVEQLQEAETVLPGDVLRYTIVFSNQSPQDVAPGSIVITNPLPEGTEYLAGSAVGRNTVISFSLDGENFASPEALVVVEGAARRPAAAADYRSIRWTFEPRLAAGDSGQVSFDLLIP